MRDQPAHDDEGVVVLSATEAAWLAKTSEQNLRNWMRSAPGFARRPLPPGAVIRFDDLQRLLVDRGAPAPLNYEWLSLRPDDPTPSVWRPRSSSPQGTADDADRPPSLTPRDLPGAKAAEATAAAELAQAWQRERETARHRDYWKTTAQGYRQALSALVDKDGRLDVLSDQPP